MNRPARLLVAALAVLSAAVPARAVQTGAPAVLQPGDPDDPVEKLGRYLRVLSADPRNLDALGGAGRAALDIGDANAAIAFFARAEAVAPHDGRIKAGIGSALVQMEKPKEALRLFAQAIDLGVPAASLAADRGLAYDLRGDNRRAQADYALALRARPSDETVRRLALSQAMSGDRAAALATLDPLLRRQDRAAWRASTFVLAMTGDARAAGERLGQLVSPQQAAALAPFLGRLAALRPADQAEAVHFGHLPSDGRAAGTALADAGTRAGASAGGPLGAATPAAADPFADAARRRPGHDPAATPATVATVTPATVTRTPPARVAAAEPPPIVASPPPAGATRLAVVTPPPVVAFAAAATPPVAAVTTPVPDTTPAPVAAVPARGISGPVDPRFPPAVPVRLARAETAPAPALRAAVRPAPVTRASIDAAPEVKDRKPVAEPTTESEAAKPKRGRRGADGVGADRAATDERGKDARPGKDARKSRDDDVKEARAADAAKDRKAAAKEKADKAKLAAAAKEKADKAKLAAAAKKAPSRYWVQVATGAYKADLPKAWAKVKAQYPALMAGKSPWTTPLRFTNRVLVGPFRSGDEAQAFVNTAGKAGFGTSPFTSPAGQAVERLAAK